MTNISCASVQCQLPPLSKSDGRIEIKAVLPGKWSGVENACVRWKRNGEAAFHVECWSAVLKAARSRGRGRGPSAKTGAGSGRESQANPAPTMRQAERLMIVNAAKTLEKFDSLKDIKKAARKAAALIRGANHCIAVTGAGISTSAGLGDFRGKSGKWTEEDQSALDGVIQAALQMDTPETSTSSAEDSITKSRKRSHEQSMSSAHMKDPDESESHAKDRQTSAGDCGSAEKCDAENADPPAKQHKPSGKDSTEPVLVVAEDPTYVTDNNGDEPAENVDYDNLRPTYTHEALSLLMERGLLQFVISQNCDGLHLLSGIPQDRISELHGNVFMEKCPRCERRYSRSFYVLHDEASQYYEEVEDYGESEVPKPRFATQCHLCGLCHRTGRRCEEKGCNGYLEDTIINFRDNLEEAGLDRAMDEAGESDIILCLGTTLMVTPACDIVDGAEGEKPLIICNRQKTDKDDLACVRVFGDCDVFMAEVLAYLLDKDDKKQWEEKRGERMKQYNMKRQNSPADKDQSHPCDGPSELTAGNKGKRKSKK